MAIFSKSIESAQDAVTKAASVVAEWEGKAAAARAEAARLDAESGAAILADESAAETISLNIQAQERKARAFDGAAAEARTKLHKAQREVLEAEAREEDKLAAAARKASAAHLAKLDALKRDIETLDECEWDRADGNLGKEGVLEHEAHRHETRAGVIRYYLSTGRIPHDFYLIDKEVGTKVSRMSLSFNSGDYIPDSLRAAQDAGLTFAGASA
ncbi:hypothetical protein ACIQCM_08740 [Pseudarthrobacter sp. NPDC092439]|uniref:hypothetical protein n=1 Tax=unclassified Pseudarthrobacter TaxID=2647000 RepID=UPI00381E8970